MTNRKREVMALKGRQEVAGPVAMRQTGELRINAEDRRRMISEAAFYRAERRGFVGGDPEQDWYEAELEINDLIGCRAESHGAPGRTRSSRG